MKFDREEWERVIGASNCFYGRDLTPLVKWCENVAEPLGVSALEFARWANARGLLLMRDATAEKFKASRQSAEAVKQALDSPIRYDWKKIFERTPEELARRAALQAAPAPKAAKPKPAARKPAKKATPKPLATDWNSVVNRYLASKGRAKPKPEPAKNPVSDNSKPVDWSALVNKHLERLAMKNPEYRRLAAELAADEREEREAEARRKTSEREHELYLAHKRRAGRWIYEE